MRSNVSPKTSLNQQGPTSPTFDTHKAWISKRRNRLNNNHHITTGKYAKVMKREGRREGKRLLHSRESGEGGKGICIIFSCLVEVGVSILHYGSGLDCSWWVDG